MRFFIMCFSNFETSKKIVLETFCNNKNLLDEMKNFFLESCFNVSGSTF